MDAPEPTQLVVVKRLDTGAQTIDTSRAKTFQLVAIDSLGIGLERDFAVRVDFESIANGGHDRVNLVRIEQRRRAAAEKDRIDSFAGFRAGPDVTEQRRDVL